MQEIRKSFSVEELRNISYSPLQQEVINRHLKTNDEVWWSDSIREESGEIIVVFNGVEYKLPDVREAGGDKNRCVYVPVVMDGKFLLYEVEPNLMSIMFLCNTTHWAGQEQNEEWSMVPVFLHN